MRQRRNRGVEGGKKEDHIPSHQQCVTLEEGRNLTLEDAFFKIKFFIDVPLVYTTIYNMFLEYSFTIPWVCKPAPMHRQCSSVIHQIQTDPSNPSSIPFPPYHFGNHIFLRPWNSFLLCFMNSFIFVIYILHIGKTTCLSLSDILCSAQSPLVPSMLLWKAGFFSFSVSENYSGSVFTMASLSSHPLVNIKVVSMSWLLGIVLEHRHAHHFLN